MPSVPTPPPDAPEPKFVKIRGIQTDVNQKEFAGDLLRVKFHNPENDYTICEVGQVTCKGTLPARFIGARYKLTGRFAQDPKTHEWFFWINEARYRFVDGKGMGNYLAKECPEIGPVLANKLTQKYKNDVVQRLAKDIHDVKYQVPGFPRDPALISKIELWAKTELKSSDMKRQLYQLGLLPAQVRKMFDHYGLNAEDILRKDTFQIIEVDGFGFKTADKISIALGVPRNNKRRIEAGIIYTAENSTQDGHTCFDEAQLLRMVCTELNLGPSEVREIFTDMLSSGKLTTDMTDWEAYRKEQRIEY